MASRYMRFFEAPAAMGEGTIFAMSMSATEALDKYEFYEYCVKEGITVSALDPDEFVCRDDSGCRMSSREVLLRPPLSDEQVQALGDLAAHRLVDGRHNNVVVVDCRANPEKKYSPVIAMG